MTRKRLSEDQIIAILREREASIALAAHCLKHSMASGSFNGWKAKIRGDVGLSLNTRVRENQPPWRLKRQARFKFQPACDRLRQHPAKIHSRWTARLKSFGLRLAKPSQTV